MTSQRMGSIIFSASHCEWICLRQWARVRRHGNSIVVARLQEVDSVARYQVHDAMLLRESARPCIRRQILERFRLADTDGWITQYGLDQGKNSRRDLPVGLDPVSQVLQKFGLKDGLPSRAFCRARLTRSLQARARGAVPPPILAQPFGFWREPAQSKAVRRSLASEVNALFPTSWQARPPRSARRLPPRAAE